MIDNKYTDLLFDNKMPNKYVEVPNVELSSENNTGSYKKALILSKVSIDSGAGGTRVSNLVDLLDHCGCYETSAYVFSKGKKLGDVIKQNKHSKFVALDDYSGLTGIKKYKKLFYNKKTVKKIIDFEKPDVVIIYSVLSFRNISFIKKYTKKKKIKLVFDVVESRKLFSSFSPFAFFGYNLHNYLINHFYIDKKTVGVICPTYYLRDFFENKRKCKCVFVFPITMKVNLLPKYSKESSIDKIIFLYAGNPANKRDLMINTIKGFNLLPNELKNKIIFIICGPTSDFLIEHEGLSINDYQASLDFTLYLGTIDKNKLYNLYRNVDYSVLLKNPTKRFSKAGFPTKMAECFACAIPMVANLSGDMKYYMKDGFNSIVSENTTPESFKEALVRAITLSNSNHQVLSKNALQTAKTKLDNSIFYQDFYNFIK